MSKVILYTTHCPKCKVLETRLRQAHVEYEIIEDENVMLDKGFMEAPMLQINDDLFDYSQAMKEVDKLCDEGA